MMEGYLDISGCSESWTKYIGIDRIPVRLGAHEKQLDIMEHVLPPLEVESLRAWMKKKYRGAGLSFREDWPIGFDLKSIPPGAILHLEG